MYLLPMMILMACGNTETTNTDSIPLDTLKAAEIDKDTVEKMEVVVEEEVKAVENQSIEEAEKGGGLSFCDCVKKQKEIDDKMVLAEADDEVEVLLNESEKLRNGICKVLKAGNQMTAAEKKAREAKVKACLGN